MLNTCFFFYYYLPLCVHTRYLMIDSKALTYESLRFSVLFPSRPWPCDVYRKLHLSAPDYLLTFSLHFNFNTGGYLSVNTYDG